CSPRWRADSAPPSRRCVRLSSPRPARTARVPTRIPARRSTRASFTISRMFRTRVEPVRNSAPPNDSDARGLLPLAGLLQLASPALPIGAYSYSQGLEWVVEAGIVRDAEGAQSWISELLSYVIGTAEAPVLWRLLRSAGDDWTAFSRWNAWFRASRET